MDDPLTCSRLASLLAASAPGAPAHANAWREPSLHTPTIPVTHKGFLLSEDTAEQNCGARPEGDIMGSLIPPRLRNQANTIVTPFLVSDCFPGTQTEDLRQPISWSALSRLPAPSASDTV